MRTPYSILIQIRSTNLILFHDWIGATHQLCWAFGIVVCSYFPFFFYNRGVWTNLACSLTNFTWYLVPTTSHQHRYQVTLSTKVWTNEKKSPSVFFSAGTWTWNLTSWFYSSYIVSKRAFMTKDKNFSRHFNALLIQMFPSILFYFWPSKKWNFNILISNRLVTFMSKMFKFIRMKKGRTH